MSKSTADRRPPEDADDATLLNWILWEMAERLGLVSRSPDNSHHVDVVQLDVVEDFFTSYDLIKECKP